VDTRHSASEETTCFHRAVKKLTKRSLHLAHTTHWATQLDELSVQSKFQDVVDLEPQSKVWNHLTTCLPSSQLSSILRAGADCLPTPLNLRRWRFQSDPSCRLCGSSSPTTLHILSGCPEALNQGRLTWRHDSVLQQIVKGVTKFLDKGEKVFANLPNLLATSSPPSTIPPELCSTSCRPDLVVWSPDTDEIRILELMVCHNSISSIESARKRKQEKQPYSELTSDLEMAGHTVFYDTIEIGSLGHYLKSSMQALASTIPNARRQDLTKLITSLAKTAIGCSATIFHARNSPIWEKSKPLYTPLF